LTYSEHRILELASEDTIRALAIYRRAFLIHALLSRFVWIAV